MQFNAVVENNVHARHLYERLGFVLVGTIPNGFLMKDGTYRRQRRYYARAAQIAEGCDRLLAETLASDAVELEA